MGYWPDFNLQSVFILKNIFNMKNVTDFRKTVETGVDPHLQRQRQRRPDLVLKHTCQTGRLFKLPVQVPSHSLKTKIAGVGRLQKKQVQTGTKRNRFHQI